MLQICICGRSRVINDECAEATQKRSHAEKYRNKSRLNENALLTYCRGYD